MIGRLNHIAIAVPDLAKAAELYRTVMGAKVSAPKAQPAHGVTVVFVELPNTKIELLHPLGEKSPIANFLARNADGGIHHVCYEVEDIYAARDRLKAQGARVLGDGEPKIGAHDKPVLFLHPKDFYGHADRAGAGLEPIDRSLCSSPLAGEAEGEPQRLAISIRIDLRRDRLSLPPDPRPYDGGGESAMSWATGVMVYLVIWWTILFAVLPLGVRRVENPGRERSGALRSGLSSRARRSSPRSSPPCCGSASISFTRRTSSASAGWSSDLIQSLKITA